MRILILEDEPIIAIDLEDIVIGLTGAECVLATTAEAGAQSVEDGVDFAILDIDLGKKSPDGLPIASMLLARGIPFCFLSSNRMAILPLRYVGVPFVAKPFRLAEIAEVLPVAA